jgi:cytoskeletal protein CcmA (bactofilin family)
MRQQKGFVLVSVLIITTITTMLAFSQLSENRLQERIAGNQRKAISARLAAEKGIFDAFDYIKEHKKEGDTNTQILAVLNAWPAHAYYSFPETIMLDGTTFALLSKGEVHGAIAYLKTEIEAFEITGHSVFTDAVAGCDGVSVGSGGGTVDSYNSKEGGYGADLKDADGNVLTDADGYVLKNILKGGTVATLNSDADIMLSGSGSIYGDLISNGDITTGTSSGSNITGEMTAAGNIQLKGMTSTGNIHSGGDFDFSGLEATGQEITVGGDLSGGEGDNDIQSSVVYGGNNESDLTTAVQSDEIQPPDTDMGNCDPVSIPGTPEVKGIKAVMQSITDEADGLSSVSSADMTEAKYTFTENSVSSDGVPVVGGTSSTIAALGAAGAVSGMGSLDENTKVIILDGSLELENKTIQIDGNVTLLIKGDIHTKNTTLEFTDPTASSLTILTTGKIGIQTGTDLFSGETINSEGNPPLTVYSSYENDVDYALNITANADIYTKLYAPLGNLNLGGGGEIMGAVRGKNVNISADTGIHYDEVLGELIDIEDENPIVASYSSAYYYYPDE